MIRSWHLVTRASVLSLFVSLTCCTAVSKPNLSNEQFSNDPVPLTDSLHSAEPTSQHNAPEIAPFSIEDRMILVDMYDENNEDSSMGVLYSFRARAMSLVDALALFGEANKLNIVPGPDIEGEITVNFHELPLEQAMSTLLDAHGYYWVRNQKVINVRRLETRAFNVDYIRLIRGGTGQNKAQITSGTGAGGAGQDTGEITVNQQVEIKFWEELQQQITSMLSDEGRLVMNRLSGTIQITDRHQRVQNIAKFLAKVRRSLYRQVEIEARIYEVNLNDNYNLGIDWTKINFSGMAGSIAFSNIITTPFGGFIAKPETAKISLHDGDFNGVLKALREQGELRVVSQPRVLTLNNQPALIKVATDQSFFTQTVVQGTAGTGNIVTEQARSVTVALVLSVTPQISDDGWIMLDVTPIISRLREIRESPQKTATAPVIDVKQSSGLVRLRDGEMVMIGGLIQDEVSETERKVPFLGDIPWVGRLFKGTYTVKSKNELVIFLSPKIVDSMS